MKRKKIIITGILFLISISAFPQKVIRGFVIDSASFIPLSYVNVKVKNATRGTSTDTKGGFSIATNRGDSLVFTLIGYNEEVFSAAELEETGIIRMAVRVKELPTVTFVAKRDKAVRSIRMTPGSTQPNYGPYGAGVNLAYFSKLEKEKRKLIRIKEEQERTRNYVMVVCSPDVRERLCKEFEITEDEYFSLLAKFNIDHLNKSYDLTKEEWITVLRNFYGENTTPLKPRE